MSAAVGYFANSAGVTLLTPASVDCADRIVATASSSGVREVELAVGVRVGLGEDLVDPAGPPGAGQRGLVGPDGGAAAGHDAEPTVRNCRRPYG